MLYKLIHEILNLKENRGQYFKEVENDIITCIL